MLLPHRLADFFGGGHPFTQVRRAGLTEKTLDELEVARDITVRKKITKMCVQNTCRGGGHVPRAAAGLFLTS